MKKKRLIKIFGPIIRSIVQEEVRNELKSISEDQALEESLRTAKALQELNSEDSVISETGVIVSKNQVSEK